MAYLTDNRRQWDIFENKLILLYAWFLLAVLNNTSGFKEQRQLIFRRMKLYNIFMEMDIVILLLSIIWLYSKLEYLYNVLISVINKNLKCQELIITYFFSLQ